MVVQFLQARVKVSLGTTQSTGEERARVSLSMFILALRQDGPHSHARGIHKLFMKVHHAKYEGGGKQGFQSLKTLLVQTIFQCTLLEVRA